MKLIKWVLLILFVLMFVSMSTSSTGSAVIYDIVLDPPNEWVDINRDINGWNITRGRIVGEPIPNELIEVQIELKPLITNTDQLISALTGEYHHPREGNLSISTFIIEEHLDRIIYSIGSIYGFNDPNNEIIKFQIWTYNITEYKDYLKRQSNQITTNNTIIIHKNNTQITNYTVVEHHWYNSSTNNTVKNNLSTIQKMVNDTRNQSDDNRDKIFEIADVFGKVHERILDNNESIEQLQQNVTQNRLNFELSGRIKDRNRIKQLEQNQTQLQHDRDLLLEQIELLKEERDTAKKNVVVNTSAISSAFMMVSLLVIWRMKKQ